MEKHYEKGLLFRNLPDEVDRFDGLSTQSDLRTDLINLIAEFGEPLQRVEMLKSQEYGENSAFVTFRNKYLDLNNVKDGFDGLIFENWPPLFVEVIDMCFSPRIYEQNRQMISSDLDHTYVCIQTEGMFSLEALNMMILFFISFLAMLLLDNLCFTMFYHFAFQNCFLCGFKTYR